MRGPPPLPSPPSGVTCSAGRGGVAGGGGGWRGGAALRRGEAGSRRGRRFLSGPLGGKSRLRKKGAGGRGQ